MLAIKENISLKTLNTFGMDVQAQYFLDLHNEFELFEFIKQSKSWPKTLMLGGGSNILFTKKYEGLILRPMFKGIVKVQETDTKMMIKVAAGENWDTFVAATVEMGLGGLENLSLIPGNVGTCPIQNIGAYGVEVADVLESLEAVHLLSGERITFNNAACHFGYRESIFKRSDYKNYLITSLTFCLNKNPTLHTQYGDLQNEMQMLGVHGIGGLRQAVMSIRKRKLPDPEEFGNAGSFFKNPIVKKKDADRILSDNSNAPCYQVKNGMFKLSAAWLIDQCGLKGFEHGRAAVHSKQPLVLINKGNAQASEIIELSQMIINRVFSKFGIQLHPEVNII